MNMGSINKSLTLTIIISLAVSSLMTIESAFSQSTPKPSIPQFSIRVVDYSYDIPTTYSTDSYTGKQITIPGYHVDDIRVEGKIKNQHFKPYMIPNPDSTSSYDINLNIDFYYNIRYKGHFGNEDEWMNLVGTRDVDFLKQNYGSAYTNFTASGYNARMFQEGAVVDFEVKAFIGFETWGFVGTFPYRILNGEESGWSNTLTVTISKDVSSSSIYATTIDNSPYPTLTSAQKLTPTPTSTTTATPTPTPSIPELPFVVALSLLAIIPLIATILTRKSARLSNFWI